MNKTTLRSTCHWLFLAAAVFVWVHLAGPAFAVVDDNATRQIWKLKYGVTDAQMADSAWLNQDTDGDGVKNEFEIAAGTNPFSVSNTIAITGITRNGTAVDLQFPTENGKLYRVEATTNLSDATSWVLQPQPTPVQLIGDGVSKTLTVAFGENTFYRIRVSDVDTDLDGVGDWAERAVGLNSGAAETVVGTNDHTYVSAQIALPNVVTIKAATPFASEDGPSAGKLVVTRTQNLFPTTVNLNVSGTAVAGTDYSAFSTSVAFAAHGETTANLFVNPMPQAALKGSRSVTAALMNPAPGDFPFSAGAPSSATVIINGTTVASGTGLLGKYYGTYNGTYSNSANFSQPATYAFTRGTPTNTGTIIFTATTANFVAPALGQLVPITFSSGSLNATTYNGVNYSVADRTTTTFTASITAASAFTFTSATGNCTFGSPIVERLDPTINFEWGTGVSNTSTVTATNPIDNYTSVWDGYLQPTTTGSYTFQLDADDKARVLLDTGSGLVEILEHGWDGNATPDTIGIFKQSTPITLAAPASPAQRYHIQVQHVETTGEARCRLQWKLNSGSFGNIPQASVFPHATAMTSNYSFTRNADLVTGSILVTLNISGGQPFAVNDTVPLYFSSGPLFTQAANYQGAAYTVTAATATTFTVSISASALPASGSGAGYVAGMPASATTGWLGLLYPSANHLTSPVPAGRISIDGSGPTNINNGLYYAGSPDPLIPGDNFSARWTGQVQPQFSEDYTFIVQADDGCTLWINGQAQPVRMLPSANTSGSTYTYNSTTGDLVVNYAGLPAVASSFTAGETVRIDPSSGNLNHAPAVSPTYSYDGTYLTVDYSNLTTATTRPAGSYTVGESVELDPTSGPQTSLANLPYIVAGPLSNPPAPAPTATSFAVALPPTLGISSISPGNPCVVTTVQSHGLQTGATVNIASVNGGSFSPAINNTPYTVTVISANAFSVASSCTAASTIGVGTVAATGTGNVNVNDTHNTVITSATSTTFTVNLGTGKYAANSTGNVGVDIANKVLKDWSGNTNERYVRLPMIGGTRYDIRLEYWEAASNARCLLSWYSPSQPRQIIPSERLYPSSVVQAPPSYIAPTSAIALANGPFYYSVTGSNGATVTVSGNPAWLTYSGGVLSGTPPPGTVGDFQIIITITNSAGTGTSVLNLHVDANTGSVVRENWDGVSGSAVGQIPIDTPISGSAILTSLEAATNAGDNYGARIRGYITAPVTGNYYFWIAGNNSAELWISTNDESVNAFKRAWVTSGSSTPRTWNPQVAQNTQKSPWLALEQGKKYYFEVLHKAGSASDGQDNLAVGWSLPGEATTAPSQIVPGYVLSPWSPLVPLDPGSSVYSAILRPQTNVITSSSGTSFIRLNAAETQAIITVNYSPLSSGYFGMHVHDDQIPGGGLANVICDVDQPGDVERLPDGSFRWTLQTRSGRSVSTLVSDLKTGHAYFNVHSILNPNGEIKGYYSRVEGSQTFTAPTDPGGWTDDHATNNGASRFLAQATFGANPADIAALKAMPSYDAWIDAQFAKTPTYHLPEVKAREIADVFGPFDVKIAFNTWWKTSVTGDDQLRQRVAFALSQIHVVSGQGPLEDNSLALADFYDTLLDNAFTNFRDILIGTTLTPAMGRYLDMLRNDKPDLSVGRSPNENYAREIKQLFSIGLYKMWPDGTLILDSQYQPVETYTQREIVGLAHVFTGWDYGYDGDFHTSLNSLTDWTRPMREVPARHFTGPKRLLNNEVLPGLPTLGGQPLDPYATHLSAQISDPIYQALPAQELNAVHDMLFNHINTAPFICRQLIQRLVTSNPSRGYVYRVVSKFNDNGAGVRGDMKAVIKAILLDYEARSSAGLTTSTFGKQREPLLRIANAARAFRPSNITGNYSQNGTNVITITTSAPHLLQSGNSVFLEFTDATAGGARAPTTGTYSVVSVLSTTSYTINSPGWMTGNYSQSGTTATISGLSSHYLPGDNANVIPSPQVLPAANKGRAYIDFIGGPLDNSSADRTIQTAVTSTSYDIPSGVSNTATAPSVNGNTGGSSFTITVPNSGSGSGTVMIARFPGSYKSSGRAGVITISTFYGASGTYGTMADHGLSVGNTVFLNFTNSRDTTSFNETSIENDQVYTVTSVPDPNSFTVTARDAANAAVNSDNQVVVFPLVAQPLIRNGTVSTRQGTYTMDNTDGELQQTPLNSTTVFNYFLPDYKYAGPLASNGLTTPEFQLTSETTVIRQANFLYTGLFNTNNVDTTRPIFISGFKGTLSGTTITGSNALVLDLTPWSGNANANAGSIGAVLGAGPQTGQVWTSNANVGTLIDRLNTLLLSGNLPTAAKTTIQAFIGGQVSSIASGSPCTFNMGTAHGLKVGDSVTVTGLSGITFTGASTSGNGTFVVAAVPTTSTLTFTNVNCSVSTSNGSSNLSNSTAGIIPYTNASPSAANIRDRLRTVIHFLLTSPDYTIQR